MTPTATDLLAGAVVTVLFLSIVAAAETWRRWGSPEPESTRKLIHIAGGFVALSLPFVIGSHWVVLAMSLGMAMLFLAGKVTGRLQSLHGVSRKSSGTEYYPVVIYLLFYLTQGTPWKYLVCVLVLTTADALAALVGSRYGRHRYEVDNNYKSVEGSLVFLVVTFLAVLLPLLVWPILVGPLDNNPPLATCLLTALLVAIPATGFEAISQHGRDNLWVPLGTLLILNQTLHLPLDALIQWTLILVGICAITGFAVWRTATFNVGGALVLILAAYACWTLTSIDWAMPVFFSFGFYVAAVATSRRPTVIASGPVVKALSLPCLVMMSASLALYYDAEEYRFLYGPFLAGCVTIAAQAAWDQVSRDREVGLATKSIGVIVTTCLACIAVLLPVFLLQSTVNRSAPLWIAAVVLVVGESTGMLVTRQTLAHSDRWWWKIRMLSIAAAMGLVAVLQAADLIPLWNPR